MEALARIANQLALFMAGKTTVQENPPDFLIPLPDMYAFSLIIAAVALLFFLALYFYRRLQRRKIKEQQIIAGTAEARFDALKSQLDPHFLFNSLNVLTGLIDEKPEEAQRFTTSLSRIYRYVLEQKNKRLVPLNEELEFARIYAGLLRMRFEDGIAFEIPEKATHPEAKVVPMSLQLLLENAVKHNKVSAQNPLRVRIAEENGYLTVRNDLRPREVLKKGSGVGLANIRHRYGLLTHRKVNAGKSGEKFEVNIPILTKKVIVMDTTKEDRNETAYLKAKERVKELKEFYSHLAAYCIVIPFLIFINYYSYWGYQWFWWPMFGWGIGLGIHAFATFGYGKAWEERTIKKLMNEEEQNHKTWK